MQVTTLQNDRRRCIADPQSYDQTQNIYNLHAVSELRAHPHHYQRSGSQPQDSCEWYDHSQGQSRALNQYLLQAIDALDCGTIYDNGEQNSIELVGNALNDFNQSLGNSPNCNCARSKKRAHYNSIG